MNANHIFNPIHYIDTHYSYNTYLMGICIIYMCVYVWVCVYVCIYIYLEYNR